VSRREDGPKNIIAFSQNIRKMSEVIVFRTHGLAEFATLTLPWRLIMAGKVMTKNQLVSLLAEKAGVTKAVATGMLEALAAAALSETRKNGQFVLPGLGKLVKSQRKARMGRNPQTGEALKIPAKTVVKFRVAKAAKEAVVPPKK
jgi:DNA-binding protein HU-beta